MCISRSYLVFFVLILASASIIEAENVPSCLDDDGKPVDWYIVYKLPLLSDDVAPFNTGYSYAYFTSENVKESDPIPWTPSADTDIDSVVFLNRFKALLLDYLKFSRKLGHTAKKQRKQLKEGGLQWTVSNKLMTDPQSMVLRTLRAAYEKEHANLNTIFYNDAPSGLPKKGSRKNSAKAHAKGSIIIDEITGDSVWLTHSIPHFPPQRNEELKFHTNFRTKAQTFMCLNFDLRRSGKEIVDHLVNMRPLVYDSYISEHLYSMIPELYNLNPHIKKRFWDEKTKLAQVITTKGGQDLNIYSKSANFGEDMYANWMNKELDTTLLVETWRNGAGGSLGSSCPRNDFHVNNVQDMRIYSQEDKSLSWSSKVDHSKWAISEGQESGVICIADVNRMESQFKRGGGAVCFKCSSCWSVFSKSIVDVEPCPMKPPPKTMEPMARSRSTEGLVENLKVVFKKQ